MLTFLSGLEQLTLEKIEFESDEEAWKLLEFQKSIDRLVENPTNTILAIQNARKERIANVYALLSIFDSAQKWVKIYTTNFSGSIYSRGDAIAYISDWLNEDPERKLTFLLKETPDFESKKCSHIYPLLDREAQLEIRVSSEKEAKDCNINAVIADGRIFKIKEIDKDQQIERVVINFNDPESVSIIEKSLNLLFDDEHSVIIKPPPKLPHLLITERLRNIFGQVSPPREISAENPKIINAINNITAWVEAHTPSPIQH